MGYCPRCGDNSAYGTIQAEKQDLRPRPLRVPAASLIVQLPGEPEDGSVITYGGTRFRVEREGSDYLLQLAE